MKRILSLLVSLLMIIGLSLSVSAAESYAIAVAEGVSVYVNGNLIDADTTVSDTDKVKFVAENEAAVVIGVEGVYYPLNTYFKLTGDVDLTNADAYTLGLRMVDGAQVRVGNVEMSENGRIDATADSGLRFLAVCDYADTVVADENVEFGIKITAEGNDTAAYIKADKFQDEDNSVFTVAVTNLNESNYNRKYTATAYAKVLLHDGTEAEFTEGSVTRSVYQVSVGILKNSSAEFNENLPYTIDDAVKEVLSAYVNQTGIRLSYSSDGVMSARLAGKGAYTGDLYFNVTSSLNSDGSTFVTVTPLGEDDGFFNAVEIPTWWKDYIRINNNNSVATKYISDAKLENGKLSFNFTLPQTVSYTFDQEDNVTIVSEITSEYIKGFKAGEEVTYPRAETIAVMGLAETMADVVPGSVIMVGYNSENKVAAVELLASLGLPINPDKYEAAFGVHDAGDGSSRYKNVVTEMYSKSGSKITCQNLPDTTKTTYRFESTSSMCYRVSIAMDGDKPVIGANGAKISTYPSIFESTATHHNYLYLRYDSETSRVKECVFYCVPKNLDFSGDGEYSDIFSLNDYRVIIE